jgi:hypothetical protein
MKALMIAKVKEISSKSDWYDSYENNLNLFDKNNLLII